MKLIVASFALLIAATSLHAADETEMRKTLERYRGDTQVALYLCQTSLRIAVLKANVGKPMTEENDYPACIEQGKAAARAGLERALKVAKKPKLKEALKSFQVAYISAIEGIRPGTEEIKINYEQRLQRLEDKLTETWARVEVEQ